MKCEGSWMWGNFKQMGGELNLYFIPQHDGNEEKHQDEVGKHENCVQNFGNPKEMLSKEFQGPDEAETGINL